MEIVKSMVGLKPCHVTDQLILMTSLTDIIDYIIPTAPYSPTTNVKLAAHFGNLEQINMDTYAG